MKNLLDVLQNEQARWKTEPVTLEGIQTFVQAARLVYERAVVLQHLAAAEARMKRAQAAQAAQAQETPAASDEPVIHAVHISPAEAPESKVAAQPATEERKGPVFAFAPRAETPDAPVGSSPEPVAAPHAGETGNSGKDGGPSLAQQLKQLGIPALAPAMGINDRVRFAGTFANGDVQAFLALCGEIEGMATLDQARERLKTAAGPLVDWKDEEGPAWAFLQLVQRLQKFQSV